MNKAQFREFTSAVVRHLPEISPEEAQLLIDEQERLRAILQNAFKSPEIQRFKVVMSDKIPFESEGSQIFSDLGLMSDWLSDEKDGKYEGMWPKEGSAPVTLDFRLERFGLPMMGTEVVEEMKKRGLRPATLVEMAFFLVQYSNLIKEYVYCQSELIHFAKLLPLVILDADGDNSGYVCVIDDSKKKEMHGAWLGMVFGGNSTYPAVAI